MTIANISHYLFVLRMPTCLHTSASLRCGQGPFYTHGNIAQHSVRDNQPGRPHRPSVFGPCPSLAGGAGAAQASIQSGEVVAAALRAQLEAAGAASAAANQAAEAANARAQASEAACAQAEAGAAQPPPRSKLSEPGVTCTPNCWGLFRGEPFISRMFRGKWLYSTQFFISSKPDGTPGAGAASLGRSCFLREKKYEPTEPLLAHLKSVVRWKDFSPSWAGTSSTRRGVPQRL